MYIELEKNECWYGGCTAQGTELPLCAGETRTLTLCKNDTLNQAMPLLVSSRGRSLWLEDAAGVEFRAGRLFCPGQAALEVHGDTLRDAYRGAMKKHFPFTGEMPAPALMQNPVFNTWIELTFHQNQKDVLAYAQNIVRNGYKPGVLMIDDGWSESYGDWRFDAGRFPDPAGMLEELHALGFAVMLWVCPYVSPDTVAYRAARDAGYLLRDEAGDTRLIHWWNGYSVAVDLSNPAACDWLHAQLAALQVLGVDGFKFDGGDSLYYPGSPLPAEELCRLWSVFGERYPYNEYRATWRAGGRPLFQRLCDKEHSWGNTGLAALIPDTLAQGITGHPFCCADMVGGGEYLNFRQNAKMLDGTLFVRHAGISCLLPSIQFSAAPWRILGETENRQIHAQLALRERYQGYLDRLMAECAQTGEPAARYMEYEFPHQGMEQVRDQFMLGSDLLVAPLLEKDTETRLVYLPAGRWKLGNTILTGDGGPQRLATNDALPLVLERLAT